MKIRLVMLGKTRRTETRALLEDYVTRISRYAPIEVTELRDSPSALRKFPIDAAADIVLLDDAGRQFSSEKFAAWLGEQRDRGRREVVFLCGDADGFPAALRERANMKLSLAALTLSHELARVVL